MLSEVPISPITMMRRKVKCSVFTVSNKFCGAATHGRRLLKSVTGKTVHKHKVLDLGMRSQNRILIKGIKGIVTGPGVDQLDRLKLRNPVGDYRPYLVLPDVVILHEVIVIHRRVNIGRTTG